VVSIRSILRRQRFGEDRSMAAGLVAQWRVMLMGSAGRFVRRECLARLSAENCDGAPQRRPWLRQQLMEVSGMGKIAPDARILSHVRARQKSHWR
jgi:hypothetical protein